MTSKRKLTSFLTYTLIALVVGGGVFAALYFSPAEVRYRASVETVRGFGAQDLRDIVRGTELNHECEKIDDASDRKACYQNALTQEKTSVGIYLFINGYIASSNTHSLADRAMCSDAQERSQALLANSYSVVGVALKDAARAYDDTYLSRYFMPNIVAKMTKNRTREHETQSELIAKVCDFQVL